MSKLSTSIKKRNAAVKHSTNSDGDEPGPLVFMSSVDRAMLYKNDPEIEKLIAERDPRKLSRFGIHFDADGMPFVMNEAANYVQCRRTRLFPQPPRGYRYLRNTYELLVAGILLTTIFLTGFQFGEPDYLYYGVKMFRDLNIGIVVVMAFYLAMSMLATTYNTANETAIHAELKKEEGGNVKALIDRTACNWPSVRWGILNLALWTGFYATNLYYFQDHITSYGMNFPGAGYSYLRLFRMRLFILFLVSTVLFTLLLTDACGVGMAYMFSGPLVAQADDGEDYIYEPIETGSRFSFTGNLKLSVTLFQWVRIGCIFFEMMVIVFFLMQIRFSPSNGAVTPQNYAFWSPEAWRDVIVATCSVHISIVGLLAIACYHLSASKSAAAQAFRCAVGHAMLVLFTGLCWYYMSDFITTGVRQHLGTIADIHRFELTLMLFATSIITHVYLVVLPWMRCDINANTYNTVLEMAPDLL